jgi:Bacterial regulatory proteins, luxR family
MLIVETPDIEVADEAGTGTEATQLITAAAAPYVSPGTVKTHVARLLAKLGARDRIELVITAYETGLVSASLPPPSGDHDANAGLAGVPAAAPRCTVIWLFSQRSWLTGLMLGKQAGSQR